MIIDDTFISLRYVTNIINGYGPVFNPGERLEAISNPTWVWLLAGISQIFNISEPNSIFYTSRIVGVILFIISGILLFSLLKLLIKNEAYAFFLSLIYCLNPYAASYAISGMENALVYLLLIAVLYFSQIYLNSRKVVWMLLAGFFIGLLSISRPEGFIFIIAYFCSIAVLKIFKENSVNYKDALFSLLISLSIFLIFELWRWIYYGEIMPNTVYAKNYFSLGTIKDGFKYLTAFMIYSFGAFIPIFIFAGEFSFKKIIINKKLMLVIVMMFFLANSALIVYAGGDWMPGSRLMLFTVPCFIVFLSIITSDSISLLRNKKFLYIIISISIFANIYIGRDKLRPVYSGFNFKMNQYILNENTEVARKLNEISSPGNTVLANDLGVISFFNPQLKFVDLYGLADKHISKEVKGRHFSRSAPDYFININCDYFVIIGNIDQTVINKLLNNNSSDTAVVFSLPSVNGFMKHKDFSLKYKPVYFLKSGIIFKNITTVK